MKKIITLLLLIPLTTIAAEHGGKAMEKKAAVKEQAAEHGGKAMATKPAVPQISETPAQGASEHGGKAMEKKVSEHGGTAMEKKETAEHGGKAMEKKASGAAAEHAGKPVE